MQTFDQWWEENDMPKEHFGLFKKFEKCWNDAQLRHFMVRVDWNYHDDEGRVCRYETWVVLQAKEAGEAMRAADQYIESHLPIFNHKWLCGEVRECHNLELPLVTKTVEHVPE